MAEKKPLVLRETGEIEEIQPGETFSDPSPDTLRGKMLEDFADRTLVSHAGFQDNEYEKCYNEETDLHQPMGFTTKSGLTNDFVDIQFEGVLDGFSGLTPGATYFADGGANGGLITSTAPTAAGTYVVKVGIAKSATELKIQWGEPIKNT